MAVKKQDKEGKKIQVSAMLASQPVLRYFGFNIKTKLIKGLVKYLYGFSAYEPQCYIISVQLEDED